MAELLLVRHAQASFGADDYDRLSELGWRQARWLGEHLAERKLAFDRVIRGSLRRHAETLSGIEEGMKIRLLAAENAALNEYDSLALLRAHTGKQEIRKYTDRREHFRVLREALYAWCDGSLDCEDHLPFARFRSGVLEVLEAVRSSGAKRVLVVSSGGPISAFIAEVLGMPARGVVDLNLRTRNTGLSEFHFNERGFHCVSFNAVPHLDRPGRADAISYA
jgi:broad specificity phosphatase PhoE